MENRIAIGDVKDLGDGRYVVRLILSIEPGTEFSSTRTVSAIGPEAAADEARRGFADWLKMAVDTALKLAA